MTDELKVRFRKIFTDRHYSRMKGINSVNQKSK